MRRTMTQHGGRNARYLSRSAKCKFLVVFVLCAYTIITVYAVHVLFVSDIPLRDDINGSPVVRGGDGREEKLLDVEVWGKAAIGLYLWEHILEGPLESRLGGVWSYGEKQIGRVRFKFRTGPGVVPQKVPRGTRNVVLILNGREPGKIEFARAWMNSLDSLVNLKNVAVVLLGNEQCENNWFLWYMQNRGGPAKVAFTVYDIPYKDNEVFYQWPLGVATYRGFPNVPMLSVDTEKPRKYKCNFLGTVYHPSSRETLQKVINQHKLHEECYIRAREMWSPSESAASAKEFYDALKDSDLTLCPVGINTECYRIYEACSHGSVPVVEDIMTSGECGKGVDRGPLQLLKAYKAPFIFIQDWNELPRILEEEKRLTQEQLSERRRNILKWYKDFKAKMRDEFVSIIERKFSV